jgi:hypothetical protein
MMTRREFPLLVFGLTAAGQQSPPAESAAMAKVRTAAMSDPLLRAIFEEVARAKTLRSLGESIYYIEVTSDDAEAFSLQASLGSSYAPTRNRLRPLRIQVRVGGPTFDNTNSLYSEYYSGTRFDPETLPLDNDLMPLKQHLWLGLDRAYKTAVEAFGKKGAALRGVTVTDPLPDFWPSAPVSILAEARRPKIDEDLWTNRTKALSAIFLNYPEITASTVEVNISQGLLYVVNTLGTVARVPDQVFILRTVASRQAANGMFLYDGVSVLSTDLADLPPEAELRQATEGVAKNVMDMAAAPMGEAYVGPVMFAGAAAGQIFGEVIGSQLGILRRPVMEQGRQMAMPPSELDGRIGARVLPEWMDLVDDPTLREYNKRRLLGYYQVDLEGTQPRRVAVVEKGVLKALLTSRQPVRGMSETNGHARLPGQFGVKTARISNLFVKAAKTESDEKLKARLVEMIKQQGKPYGMLVRKMDFPSSGSAEELRRIASRAGRSGGGGYPVSSPILLYRVYPDGREELVRGLRFRSLTARSFRDIIACGDQETQFNYLENGAPMALSGAGSYVVGCSVIAPSLLFEELELEPSIDDLPKPPVVAPPPVSAP